MSQVKACNVLVIDFCDTLVCFQTADHFVKYTIRQSGLFRRIIFVLFYRAIFFKLFSFAYRVIFGAFCSKKEYLTYFLCGVKIQTLNSIGHQYCDQVLIPMANWSVIEYIKNLVHVKRYGKIFICSGGYKFYMQEFCRIAGLNFVDKIIATELAQNASGVLTGGIKLDCMGNKKVELINSNLVAPYSLTTITDSISDWPIMKKSHSVFFVEEGKVSLHLLIASDNFHELETPPEVF